MPYKRLHSIQYSHFVYLIMFLSLFLSRRSHTADACRSAKNFHVSFLQQHRHQPYVTSFQHTYMSHVHMKHRLLSTSVGDIDRKSSSHQEKDKLLAQLSYAAAKIKKTSSRTTSKATSNVIPEQTLSSSITSSSPSSSSSSSSATSSTMKSSSSSSISSAATISGFGQLGLDVNIVQALSDLTFHTPTPVQRAIIPRLLSDESIVMAASTGSGKTLAFLLPVLQQLLQQEAAGYARKVSRPRCLILTPTRELAEQILAVVKQLGHRIKVSSCSVLGGESYSIQKRSLDRLVDVVVASPGRLLQHKLQGNVMLSHVSHVIIDEVDTMFTQGFGAEIRGILRAVLTKKKASLTPATDNPQMMRSPQLIFATATLTKSVKALLQEMATGKPATSSSSSSTSSDDYDKFAVFDVDFPDPENLAARKRKLLQQKQHPSQSHHSNDDHIINNNDDVDEQAAKRVSMKVVQVDGVHRGLSNIKYVYVEVNGGDDKIDSLLQVLPPANKIGSNKGNKILIFCNTVASCRAVQHRLAEHYNLPSSSSPSSSSSSTIRLYAYHGDMISTDRRHQLDEYRGSNKQQPDDKQQDDVRPRVMVCTDIAARGIDIPDVDHVILFDFPLNPIDFLHRSGRCGRMGKQGKVTSLLAKRDLVLATAIQGAMSRCLPLDNLSSSKRDYQDSGKLAPMVGRLSRHDMMQQQQQKKRVMIASGSRAAAVGSGRSGAGSSIGGRTSRRAPSSSTPAATSSSSSSAEKKFVGRGVGRVPPPSSRDNRHDDDRSSKPKAFVIDRSSQGSRGSARGSVTATGSKYRPERPFSPSSSPRVSRDSTYDDRSSTPRAFAGGRSSSSQGQRSSGGTGTGGARRGSFTGSKYRSDRSSSSASSSSRPSSFVGRGKRKRTFVRK